MDDRPSVQLLVAGLRRDAQTLIAEGTQLVWESYKLDPYVQRFAESTFNFQEMVDDLLVVQDQIDMDIRCGQDGLF